MITVDSQPVRPVACLERSYLLQVSPSGPLLSAAWLSADAEQPSAVRYTIVQYSLATMGLVVLKQGSFCQVTAAEQQ